MSVSLSDYRRYIAPKVSPRPPLSLSLTGGEYEGEGRTFMPMGVPEAHEALRAPEAAKQSEMAGLLRFARNDRVTTCRAR